MIHSMVEKIKASLDTFGIVPISMWDEIIRLARQENLSIVSAMLELGVISDPETGPKFADQWGITYLSSIDKENIDFSLKGKVEKEVAKKWKVFPIGMREERILLAICDPLNLVGGLLEDEIGFPIEPLFLECGFIEDLLNTAYPEKSSPSSIAVERHSSALRPLQEELSPEGELGSGYLPSAGSDSEDAPMIALIEEIILGAYKERASDIHIEPFEEWVRVRYRIDGILHEIDRISKDLHGSMVTRIKIMANMDIAEKRLPQDGRILFEKGDVNLDLRVSTINTGYGETVVIRLLNKQVGLISLNELGMEEDLLQEFRRLINLPYGMLLVTGPTGSGKSTTLYAALSEIDHNLRKIITVEDPVEYQLSGINQVQVRPLVGLTFASALRSILRQAPDVILVGEIRDRETAQIAVQAALTGHLVLSTLHTNDAPSAITRLVDMGVPSYLVASCIAGVLAQRLVRRLCPVCKVEVLEPQKDNHSGEPVAQRFRPSGCQECKMTGFKGRLGIFELMTVDTELRDVIARGAPAEELRYIAESKGMQTLRDNAFRKVKDGVTTVSEIMRVVK